MPDAQLQENSAAERVPRSCWVCASGLIQLCQHATSIPLQQLKVEQQWGARSVCVCVCVCVCRPLGRRVPATLNVESGRSHVLMRTVPIACNRLQQ